MIKKTLHINSLELLAIFFGLKCFASHLLNCEILLRVDNMTAISYVNRMGGVQFPDLTATARSIWQWCEHRNIWIFASYIKSSENAEADKESRNLPGETKWSFSNRAFQSIVTKLGKPNIDLFASRCNRKCFRFASWGPDPEAFAIDAFTLDWSVFSFYAFPPFILISRVLQKIIYDQAEGTLVVPFWPSQPWYPLFCSLLTTDPVYLLPEDNLLSLPNRSHPLRHSFTLVAGRLSGKLCNSTISMEPPQKS